MKCSVILSSSYAWWKGGGGRGSGGGGGTFSCPQMRYGSVLLVFFKSLLVHSLTSLHFVQNRIGTGGGGGGGAWGLRPFSLSGAFSPADKKMHRRHYIYFLGEGSSEILRIQRNYMLCVYAPFPPPPPHSPNPGSGSVVALRLLVVLFALLLYMS